MEKEDLIIEFTRILKKAPNLMTAITIAKFAPFGQKKARDLIKSGELRSIKYRGCSLVLKDDLIEYLANTANIPRRFGFMKEEEIDEN
jgi:hypothetical protein